MMQPVWHEYHIASGIVAFSTTRHGGVSEGSYAAFNVNHYCGDKEQAIAFNRKALCQKLGIAEERLVYPHQTHQTVVREIDDGFFSVSSESRQKLLEGVDAVMTNLSDVCIGVSTADCIPVLLYDEAHHAVAAIHAGWRGTVDRIVEKTVSTMQRTYQTVPSDLQAVIGPGISLKNFEVGDEVYDHFASQGFPMEKLARRYPVSAGEDGAARWHIDLPLCNQLQLQIVGVSECQIHQSGICTYDQVDDFFSARRLGINSGRILTGIMIAGK